MPKPSQVKATQKYITNHYDRIVITLEKGRRDVIKAAASAAGESVNGYIKRAIEMRMQKEREQ